MIMALNAGDKEPGILKYTSYPELSPTTLYLKVNQALLYLLERLDTKEKLYTNFRELINISRIRGIGIQFAFKKDIEKPLATIRKTDVEIPVIQPEVIKSIIIPPNWKDTLTTFIEKAIVGDSLTLKDLNLTKADGDYIEKALPNDTCILY